MTTLAIALAAALAVACVLLAARPFLRESAPGGGELAAGPGRERGRLAEERDRTLAALKDLEFDHRTGKISDADYRVQVGVLRAEAAAALKALDEQEGRRAPSAEREETRA